VGPDGALSWLGEPVARLERGRSLLTPRLRLDAALATLAVGQRDKTQRALEDALASRIARLLGPLLKLDALARERDATAELRALALHLVEAGGVLPRSGALDSLAAPQRERLRRSGMRIGAIDVFHPDLLKPGPLALWAALASAWGLPTPAVRADMPPAIAAGAPVPGYRLLGREAVRVDLADKLLRAAHAKRVAAPRRRYALDPALAVSMGLSTAGYAQLLRLGGFRVDVPRPLPSDRFGPPAPPLWEWRPSRMRPKPVRSASGASAAHPGFAALAAWGGG